MRKTRIALAALALSAIIPSMSFAATAAPAAETVIPEGYVCQYVANKEMWMSTDWPMVYTNGRKITYKNVVGNTPGPVVLSVDGLDYYRGETVGLVGGVRSYQVCRLP